MSQNGTDSRDVENLVWYFLPIVITVPLLGLPANVLVVRLLLGKAGICCNSEVFTLNLALFDTLFCLMLPIEYIRFLFVCTTEAANFLSWGLNQVGGPLLLCLLAMDSYVAVCLPLVFLRLKEPKLRPSLCLLVCAVAVGCCVLAKARAVFKWNVIMGLLISVMVTTSTCNILILRSLCQSGPGRKGLHPVKKRAFKTVLTTLVLINVHYLPPVIEYLLKTFGPHHIPPYSSFTSVAYMALSMASVVKPLSYLVRTNQLPRMSCERRDA